ncbi:uncharacterized protein LOC125038974 [Penaeus chinensis]|uniref:uncharacterized protein LOC125038974 n=1 Tax=Penaeus chinensis TaxID=139456 RepID=UPI001FB837FE|nr:uncharacterized protein LOC125038974 [Penaeus chinensis]
MRILWTCLLALLLAGIGLLQVVAGKDCENNEYCNRKNGSCYWKDEESCNGSSFSYGCSEKGCACCVTDETVCIEKNFCAKRNGTCIPKDESCNGEVLLEGCHTDGCHCCVENPVNITVECEPKDCSDYNGTCFERGKVPCNGTIYSRGCKDVFCACCVPAFISYEESTCYIQLEILRKSYLLFPLEVTQLKVFTVARSCVRVRSSLSVDWAACESEYADLSKFSWGGKELNMLSFVVDKK